MEKNTVCYSTYVELLETELIPAMGCTEPIALAYCAAKAREVLGEKPEKTLIEVSGNIVKNVKSVIVPNTDGLKGIEAAAAAGIVGGQPDKVLEVIADITEAQKEEIRRFLKEADITVKPMEDTEEKLDIKVSLQAGDQSACVRIAGTHTNIVLIKKNEEVLLEKEQLQTVQGKVIDRSLMNIKDILDFAETCDLEDVREPIERQLEYNMAIAEEGLKNNWGANVGSVLLSVYGDDVKVRAKAYAAAGSDARMSGCELPVIINSGSGNQGITASMPVAVYAEELGADHEELLRAMVLSDLVAMHLKTGIGPLSAYCGAVMAACGAGCGIAYMRENRREDKDIYRAITHTIVNALAVVSGIVCDGAKPSCAGKIASAVDAAILGYEMYLRGQQYYGGDGIVSKGVENTIRNVGRLGMDGMRETDKEIIRIMTDC